jgi:hypothetical protein
VCSSSKLSAHRYHTGTGCDILSAVYASVVYTLIYTEAKLLPVAWGPLSWSSFGPKTGDPMRTLKGRRSAT